MSSTSPSTVPPGWYPDPAGARQWRVWTGLAWSELTRSYGEPAAVTSLVQRLSLVSALRRLVNYATIGLYAGLGLVVSVLAHWPASARPVPTWFATTALDTGLALLVLGSTGYAFAARELEGRWSLWALMPGLNVIVVTGVVTQRLHGQVSRRIISETILLGIYVSEFHHEAWLAVVPVMLALSQYRSTWWLIEQLDSQETPPSIGS